MTAILSPPRRIFYGWFIVAGVFVIATITSGLAFYNLSILLAAFVAERGFPVALASSATATFFVASGIGGVISGRLIERIDARFVMAAGAVAGGLALASLSLLRETWQLYAFHVVFGLAYGASGLVPATTLVARWFNVRRALAFSIAFTGLSFGGILIAPAVALTIERLGLSGAAPYMGLVYFLGVVPVTLLVLRPSPASMGLAPDGATPAQLAESVQQQPAVSYSEAWRSRYFYAVSIAYLFLLGAQVGAIAHIYRLANGRAGVATAALTLAVMATASTLGRLLGGWLMLWVPTRGFALALMAMQAAALALLAFAADRTAHPRRRGAVRRDHGQLADDASAVAGGAVRHARLRPHLFHEPARHHDRGRRLPRPDRPDVRGERRLRGAVPGGRRRDARRLRGARPIRNPPALGEGRTRHPAAEQKQHDARR